MKKIKPKYYLNDLNLQTPSILDLISGKFRDYAEDECKKQSFKYLFLGSTVALSIGLILGSLNK